MSRFAVVPTAWVRSKELTGSDKLVLVALAAFADSRGYCWPSVARLAEEIGMSVRSVQYSLKRLAELGVVVVKRRVDEAGDYTTNGYWITGYDTMLPAKGVVQPVAPGGATDCTRVVQPIAPGWCNPLHPNNTSITVPVEQATTTAEKLSFPHDDQQAAYEHYRATAAHPAAFDASLKAIIEGMTSGQPVPVPTAGAALVEMLSNGDAWNASRFRGYCRGQARATSTPTKRADVWAQVADNLEAMTR
jgi:hypothetical protein